MKIGLNPVVSASVSVKVTNPWGSSSTYSAKTDVSGSALVNYRLSYWALKGTYTVTATASKTGYTSASVKTSFSVK